MVAEVKRCPKCKQEKEVSSFAKCLGKSDGLQSWCRSCRGVMDKNYKRSEAGKEIQRKHAALFFARNPEQANARNAVRNAQRSRRLHPGPCEMCGATKDIEAHHHKGYDKEHCLDVQWLCRKHHREVHRVLQSAR